MEKKTEDKLKKLAKDVTGDVVSRAAPVAEEFVSKAVPVVDDIKAKAAPVAHDILEKAEPVLSIVREKTGPAAKKASKAAKNVGDSLSNRAAKVTCKEEIFVQYNQHEIRTTDIMDKAKDDYLRKGNKLSDIKEIQVYIKPSDNAAYYVVNHSETGKIEF